jgi:hypothetical protein
VFNANTTNYTVNVANSVTTISITGVAQDATATVSGNVTDAPLNVGSNSFSITVTAQDNSTKKYNVTVIRANQFTIVSSVENNTGGAISPEGSIAVDEGEDITFEMLPDENYVIEYVLVDGEDVGTDAAYTFNKVAANHTIVVKFMSTTSIESVENQQIRIYPNPTDGQLIIDNGQWTIENVEIFNVIGQSVYSSTLGVASTLRLDVSHLPSGIYFIRIQTENGVVAEKIVKK